MVDDEVEIAQMVREVLNRDHHQVAVATSGREALERLAEHPVDLILSDLRMPDLDGPDTASRTGGAPSRPRPADGVRHG